MSPKTLVIGHNGHVGGCFYRRLLSVFPDLIGTSRRGAYPLDLLNPQINFSLEGYSWALIAAGYATPQRCMENYALCRQIDLEGVLSLAKQCVQKGVTPIIFSTTQVFDGSEPCYYPESKTSPVNWYGMLHAEREEKFLDKLRGNCLILRLCRVYGNNSGIISELIRELMQKLTIDAAVDQILQLVSVEEVISCLFDLQKRDARGIYQICPKESVSRYEIACYIARTLGLSAECVRPITMSQIDNIPRPKFTFLASCQQVQSWRKGVDTVVNQHRGRAMEECEGAFL